MRIKDALPIEKYAKAAAHARSDEFVDLKKKAIARVQSWYADKQINQEIKPALWFSYGKDSMAAAIILRLAKLPATFLTINNGGDLPIHWTVVSEWDKFFGKNDQEMYVTKQPLVQTVRSYLDWGNSYGFRTKDGKLLNFWEWGHMQESISYEVSHQFQFLYGNQADNILFLWANRQGEGQERAFEIARRGLFQKRDNEKNSGICFFRGLPIGEWKDIDVWALLIEQDAPVSPIYSFNQIPQCSGKNTFPRTLAYCSPDLLSSQLYKWLARYAPAQWKELNHVFPEIPARYKQSLLSRQVEINQSQSL